MSKSMNMKVTYFLHIFHSILHPFSSNHGSIDVKQLKAKIYLK